MSFRADMYAKCFPRKTTVAEVEKTVDTFVEVDDTSKEVVVEEVVEEGVRNSEQEGVI